MGRSRDVLIPARFLLTAGNFITVVLAFYNVDANVASGVAAGGDAAAAKSSLLAALSISVIAFAPQFFGLFGGATLFLDELNLFHSVLHFFGGVLTAWYLIDSWGYASYWCVLRRANVAERGVYFARRRAARPMNAPRRPQSFPRASCRGRRPLFLTRPSHNPRHAPLPTTLRRPIMIIFNLLPACAEAFALLRLYYAAKRA